MDYRILANLVVTFHFVFILFAVFGAALLLWKRWLVFLHLPAVCWAIYIEVSHGICPLTPFEKHLRIAADQAGYSGGFIEHYIIPIVYPAGLTAQIQIWLALAVFVINALLYTLVIYLSRRRSRH